MSHKFLIQIDEVGIPSYDFCYQMINACNYKTWFDITNPYAYSLSENIGISAYNDYIPIGSVEFVHQFLEQYYNIKNIKPINIPIELQFKKYLKRECWFNNTKEFIVKLFNSEKLPAKKFIKSTQKIKYFTKITDDLSIVPDGRYLFSELIDIKSEWRTFVFNQKIVGLQNYTGDFTIFPDIQLIHDMINNYKDCPPAYTLDVGINENDGTFLIEVHNFYSCGLYGFADNRILPNMFEKSFKWIIDRSK